MVLRRVTAENLQFEQLNVKIGFLHNDQEEDIHMQQVEGFAIHEKENQVYKF